MQAISSLKGPKNRPNSARGPFFEFTSNTPINHEGEVKEKSKKKRKPSARPKKYKVNTDNEIKINRPSDYPGYQPQPDPEEVESSYSDNTAINLAQQEQKPRVEQSVSQVVHSTSHQVPMPTPPAPVPNLHSPISNPQPSVCT